MTLALADRHEAAVIELTAIATPPEPAKDASVVDREGHVLKLGDNGGEWAGAYLNENADRRRTRAQTTSTRTPQGRRMTAGGPHSDSRTAWGGFENDR